ncbi:MAG: hypothetical protein MZV64_50240 [Ignavibacteriales bacterium]|nr:hypothetical protein [Ignavibacteriales bacterium]
MIDDDKPGLVDASGQAGGVLDPDEELPFPVRPQIDGQPLDGPELGLPRRVGRVLRAEEGFVGLPPARSAGGLACRLQETGDYPERETVFVFDLLIRVGRGGIQGHGPRDEHHSGESAQDGPDGVDRPDLGPEDLVEGDAHCSGRHALEQLPVGPAGGGPEARPVLQDDVRPGLAGGDVGDIGRAEGQGLVDVADDRLALNRGRLVFGEGDGAFRRLHADDLALGPLGGQDLAVHVLDPVERAGGGQGGQGQAEQPAALFVHRFRLPSS